MCFQILKVVPVLCPLDHQNRGRMIRYCYFYILPSCLSDFSRRFENENREKKASRTCELSVGPEFADRVVGPAVDLVQQDGG